MSAPCSVKAKGACLIFPPRFKVTNCDLERLSCSASTSVNSNMKSGGNFSLLRRIAWLKTRVSTP